MTFAQLNAWLLKRHLFMSMAAGFCQGAPYYVTTLYEVESKKHVAEGHGEDVESSIEDAIQSFGRTV